jgi:hypothetical protein
MAWVKPMGCAHKVQADECAICHPGLVVVVATCAGCGVERSMSIPARAGTVVAKNVVFTCAKCTPRGSAVRGEGVARRNGSDNVELDAPNRRAIPEERYEQPEAVDSAP